MLKINLDEDDMILIYPSKSYEEEQEKYEYVKEFITILNKYNKKYNHNVTVRDPESKMLFKQYAKRKPFPNLNINEYDRIIALYFY